MTKNILITSTILVGAVVLMWWGRIAQKKVPTQAVSRDATTALIAEEKVYDFGTISMKDGLVKKDFVVTNSSKEAIFIPTLETSCMCTKAYIVEKDASVKGPFGMQGMGYVPPANETIGAGEHRTIRVEYDPNAHGPAGVGTIDRFIRLTDASGGVLELEIKAVVTP